MIRRICWQKLGKGCKWDGRGGGVDEGWGDDQGNSPKREETGEGEEMLPSQNGQRPMNREDRATPMPISMLEG